MSAIEVHSVPGLVYISEYIDTQLEEYLLTQIYRQPVVKWKVLANRRLQNWGGTPHSKGMIATTLPTWLLCIATRLEKDGFFPETPNHVLINEYLPGQAILSLENEIVLDFYSKGVNSVTAEEIQQYTGSLLLEPRSLLIIRDSAYQNYLHGIQESFYIKKSSWLLNYCCDGEGEQVARKKRVSLTVRLVPKTVHNVVRLGK
ncbi:Alpha-ketoglutarate-dependent dioxygenase alkB homolog 6 [Galdieria sulphuraria]|nr:Alpha-ketoglutarate-dependent dioxygenase alkB homolog 6 [Galdieria sulphuraria]